MKTLLIPVDFTTTSENAIDFAIEWSKAYGYDHIILLKTLYDSVFDAIIPSEGFTHFGQDYIYRERENATEKLNELSRKMMEQIAPNTKISTAITELPLLRAMLNVIEHEKPMLVILGSDNYSYSGDSFIAANVITIAKISPVRVLIVPSAYHYKTVHQLLVPCDFNRLENLGKLVKSYHANLVNWDKMKLLVLNIDPKGKHKQPDEQFNNAEKKLQQMLADFHYEIYYSDNTNIISGIIEFSKGHGVELIVALPGTHSFLYS